MRPVVKSIRDAINKCYDFLGSLHPVVGYTALCMAAIIISLVPALACAAAFEQWDHDSKMEVCLDSQSPRRWSSYICEEYIDGNWIEVDPDRGNYYYNDNAADLKIQND